MTRHRSEAGDADRGCTRLRRLALGPSDCTDRTSSCRVPCRVCLCAVNSVLHDVSMTLYFVTHLYMYYDLSEVRNW